MPKAETPRKPQAPKKIGRPSKYTPEIAQQICDLLSEGIPLREICRTEGFPAWRTVYDWMVRDDAAVAAGGGAGLSASIARAREIGYDAIAQECLIIADTPHVGVKKVYSSGENEGGVTVTEEDMLGHRKLQIETRLKLLAKWDPKRFGDRVQLAGDADSPIKIEAESHADRLMAALLQNIELKRQDGSS